MNERDNIREDHLDLYDSLIGDILTQFAKQGLHIKLEDHDSSDEDEEKAREIMARMEKEILEYSMDKMERDMLVKNYIELKQVLFG